MNYYHSKNLKGSKYFPVNESIESNMLWEHDELKLIFPLSNIYCLIFINQTESLGRVLVKLHFEGLATESLQ